MLEITAKPKGRPPVLLDLDKKVDKVSESNKSNRWCGEFHIAGATKDALIASNPSSSMHVQKFSKPHSCVQSLYRCLGVYKKSKHYFTTSCSSRTVQWMQMRLLPGYWQQSQEVWDSPALHVVVNSNQIPSSYIHVSVGKSTIAEKGSTAFSIKGVTDNGITAKGINSHIHVHEQEKKCHYLQCFWDIEHNSFFPLVVCSSGGMAKEITIFYNRLASL